MKCFKRAFPSLLLICMMAAALTLSAFASGSSPETTQRADALNQLSLFQGTDQGYQLDNAPNRIQGLVMLIRLLGLEEDALAYDTDTPFTDLGWGKSYVAYAYDKGLTKGTSDTTFSPNSTLTAKSYVTFLLRSAGYSDSTGGDFTYANAISYAASLGMIDSVGAAKLPAIAMNRGDMVDLSYAALFLPLKNSSRTLAEELSAKGVFTQAEGEAAGVLKAEPWVYTYTYFDNTTVTYRQQHMSGITANVLTVNLANPNVSVKTALVDNTVGATDSFQNIVKDSGAVAVINGNFFNSYDAWKSPIGHVMADGHLLFGNSGISALGIYQDGSVAIGRPGIFTRLTAGNGNIWAIYEVNTLGQGPDTSVLYTPAFGKSFTMKVDGSVLTVAGGVITSFRSAAAGTEITIPTGGYVAFMGSGFTKTDWFRTPTTGDTITRSYYLTNDNGEPFAMDGLVSMVSGAPRLVQDGAIVTTLEAGFQEDRFTTAVSPRTAVGINKEGKLLLVSVPGGATIDQMRQLMLGLGCVDAFNLDGGASCAMYYNGQYLATPGRALTVTLQVQVKR